MLRVIKINGLNNRWKWKSKIKRKRTIDKVLRTLREAKERVIENYKWDNKSIIELNKDSQEIDYGIQIKEC